MVTLEKRVSKFFFDSWHFRLALARPRAAVVCPVNRPPRSAPIHRQRARCAPWLRAPRGGVPGAAVRYATEGWRRAARRARVDGRRVVNRRVQPAVRRVVCKTLKNPGHLTPLPAGGRRDGRAAIIVAMRGRRAGPVRCLHVARRVRRPRESRRVESSSRLHGVPSCRFTPARRPDAEPMHRASRIGRRGLQCRNFFQKSWIFFSTTQPCRDVFDPRLSARRMFAARRARPGSR